jgi:hypothetical protein
MAQTTLEPPGAEHAPGGQQPVRDWTSLRRGECIEIRPSGSPRYRAYVDDRAEDGRLLWVIEKGIGSRRLFVSDDPITLYFT